MKNLHCRGADEPIEDDGDMKKPEYKNVCFDCGNKLYGKPCRDLGAITIHMGICEECKEEKAIKPAIDWESERKARYTSFDMD